MAAEPVRIRVATERPYEVVVGRDLTDELVAQVMGAPKVAIIHPPTLVEGAAAMRTRLQAKKRPSISSCSKWRPLTDVLGSSESAVDEPTPR